MAAIVAFLSCLSGLTQADSYRTGAAAVGTGVLRGMSSYGANVSPELSVRRGMEINAGHNSGMTTGKPKAGRNRESA